MTTPTEQTEIVEAVTPEPCANCGTVLATDQRYCLNCGDRRGGVRLDFIDILSEDAAGRGPARSADAVVASAEPRKTGAEGWIRHNAGLLSLAALLLLTLGGGLAIGSRIDGSESSAGTSKPQVIKVEGAGAAAADDSAAAAGDSTDDSAAADDGATSEGSKSTEGLQSADGKSSEDIEKSVDKGEPLSTGDGDLPPTDDKAAGGGSDFDTIE